LDRRRVGSRTKNWPSESAWRIL